MDGHLDEEAWRSAAVIPDLTQQSPKPGGAHPFKTEVRLLVDDRNLYVGVRCHDPDPSRIAVHTMLRDGDMDGDDSVALLFDTFGDGRNGYLFRVNAAGARLDGLISGPESFSADWDGLWEAAAVRTADGWTAEVAIPATTLRFRPGRPWGLNVQRYVPRALLDLRWSGTALDAKLWDLSRAGRLTGLEGLKQGLGFSAVPYGLVLRKQTFPGGSPVLTGRAGFDVSWNPVADLGAVLTVNTDFAETESDTRQINLTRFPLFYPEKRAFFLESSNLFTFGLGLETRFIPFYSRRVGLLQSEPVPIDAGIKLMGREGKFGLAVLDVQMRGTGISDRTNLFAGRLTYDVDEHLRLGLIGTNGEPTGRLSNYLTGFDAVWQTSSFRGDKNLAFGLWGAISGGDLPDGRRTGWGFKADYPNDLWDVSFKMDAFGDALVPELGFLPRPGTRQWSAGIAYQPRPGPGPFSSVQQFFFIADAVLVTDLTGSVESWEVFLSPLYFTMRSGDGLLLAAMPTFERPTSPFEISPGVVIPPGSYQFNRAYAELTSSKSRPLWGQVVASTGGFYGGRMGSVRLVAGWTGLRGHLSLSTNLYYAVGHLPEGDFIERLYLGRADWAFDPNLVFSALAQYDSQSRNLGSNVRFRWTIKPGCEAFLVWVRGWASPPGAPLSQLPPESDQLVAKLRWTFRW